MKCRRLLAVLCLSLTVAGLHAAPKPASFGIVAMGAHATSTDAGLQEGLRLAARARAEFMVLHGIRSTREGCGDEMFQRRLKLLNESDRPVIISPAARDWAECLNEKGQSIAQERLSFVRAALFDAELTARLKRLAPIQQSTAARFRNYTENMRWETRGVLFATVNLPANNNNFLAAAGRDNEFEDRAVANRHWLQRIFSHAHSHRMKGVVLFVDGSPMTLPTRSGRAETRDGFAEVRKQIAALAAKFPGKVLLLHGQSASGNLSWRDNIATVGVGRGAYEIGIKPAAAVMFSVRRLTRAQR